MNENELKTVLDAGAQLAAVRQINRQTSAILVPDGCKVEIFNAEEELRRTAVNVLLSDQKSFCGYFAVHATERSVIFADAASARFNAVIDYHAPGVPDHCKHLVTFAMTKTKEWSAWEGRNAKAMEQIQFAQFIEDNLLDIADPPGADVLRVVRTLEAKKDVRFASSVRLDNGESQFTYEEEIKGSAAKGQLKIPETFTLGLRPYEGTETYRVEARLRYRINEGKLSIWYELVRPWIVLDDAFKQAADQIEQATKRAILRGRIA